MWTGKRDSGPPGLASAGEGCPAADSMGDESALLSTFLLQVCSWLSPSIFIQRYEFFNVNLTNVKCIECFSNRERTWSRMLTSGSHEALKLGLHVGTAW